MGGTKPLQSVINANYSVDITSSSCTNGKIPQSPDYKLTKCSLRQTYRPSGRWNTICLSTTWKSL